MMSVVKNSEPIIKIYSLQWQIQGRAPNPLTGCILQPTKNLCTKMHYFCIQNDKKNWEGTQPLPKL